MTLSKTEIPPFADCLEEIQRMKKEKNAVILAHYYQRPEIQDIADAIGDSLELARRAKETDADVIVFCGVHFMAETAKILNPGKTVLLPDLEAGCSLAESAPPDVFARFRAMHPNHLAVTYINCTASVKALSDVICTSSSAERILAAIHPDQPVLFSPDKNLGAYLAQKTGRDLLLWQGSCIVHEQFSRERIYAVRKQFPDAVLIAHPECEEAVLEDADYIGSTAALLKFVQQDDRKRFIVATEPGIIHQMQQTAKGKEFIPAPANENCSCNECPYMRLNTIEKIYTCMKTGAPEIIVDEKVRRQAMAPLERMLALSNASPEEAAHIIEEIPLPFASSVLN